MSAVATTNGSAPHDPPEPPSADELYEELIAQIPRARAALEQLDQQKEQEVGRHAAAMAEIDLKRKRLESLIKVLGAEEPRRRRPAAGSTKSRPSDEILAQALPVILGYGDGDLFTILGTHEKFNNEWSAAHSRVIFDILREREIIGKVRREEKLHGRMLYRVLDRPAGERLLAQLQEKVNA